jgi:hypothetical protein
MITKRSNYPSVSKPVLGANARNRFALKRNDVGIPQKQSVVHEACALLYWKDQGIGASLRFHRIVNDPQYRPLLLTLYQHQALPGSRRRPWWSDDVG